MQRVLIAVDAPGRVFTNPTDPTENLENVRRWVGAHVVGVGADPVPVFAAECLQINVYGNMFVSDHIPEHLLPADMKGRSKSVAVFPAGGG